MCAWSRRDLIKATIATAGSTVAPGALLGQSATSAQAPASSSKPVASAGPRERIMLDQNWHFAFGHVSDPARDFNFGRKGGTDPFAKSGDAGGPTSIRFDDSQWSPIQLPHDWAVGLPFIVEEPFIGHGGKRVGREFPETSIGWYRRELDITAADEGRRLTLEFDGIFRNATVFVNGHFVRENMSGYTPFEVDITDFLDYTPPPARGPRSLGLNANGQQIMDTSAATPAAPQKPRNLLVIRVDATLGEGWFYEGAGIYRHVWLRKTAPVYLAKDGTYVQTSLTSSGEATLNIVSELTNETADPARVSLDATIFEVATGKEVARARSTALIVPPGETISAPLVGGRIPSAKLWSLEEPNLYRIVMTANSDSKSIDQDEVRFGVRTAVFDAQRGFLLNGKPVKLKGTCNHQDHAGVGAAVPDSIHRYRMERLKAMNSNAIRTSHNTPADAILNACDELGIVVMDEPRTFSSSVEGLSELRRMIRRDRNHPSVVIWSLANEEPQQGSPRGAAIMTTMKRETKRLDPTRPVTAAMNNGWGAGFTDVVDVMGFNYGGASRGKTTSISEFHVNHPNKPSVGTETASTVSTRGVYEADPAKGYVTAYDLNFPSWACTAEDWWSFYNSQPWLAGGFVWTGFDYRGETTPSGVPCISSHFGLMDTCGFAKDNFHYYRVWWSTEPAMHLFPHWTWPGKEGKAIDVWCYANCETVELFLNGTSLGSKTTTKDGHLEWKVPYAAGTLEARGSSGGKVILTQRNETAGPAARIVAEIAATPTPQPSASQTGTLRADGQDTRQINLRIVDAKGNLVPHASSTLHVSVSGPAKVIGVGNGDPSCHEPDDASQRSAFMGLAAAFVRSTPQSGEIKVKITCDKLEPAELIFTSTTA